MCSLSARNKAKRKQSFSEAYRGNSCCFVRENNLTLKVELRRQFRLINLGLAITLSLFSCYLWYEQIELTRVVANQPVGAIGLKYKLGCKTEMWQRTQRENRMDIRLKLDIFQSFSIWLVKIKLDRELYIRLTNIWCCSIDITYHQKR